MSHSWKSYLLGCCGEVKRSEKKKRRSVTSKPTASSEDPSFTLAGSNLYAFTFAELKAAAQNFSMRNFIGSGGFGPVYKGFLHGKLRPGLKEQEVAVKYLDKEGFQGHREWLAGVIFLGQLRHPNLVKLIGYCCKKENRMLVYEYMARGSLESQLFNMHCAMRYFKRGWYKIHAIWQLRNSWEYFCIALDMGWQIGYWLKYFNIRVKPSVVIWMSRNRLSLVLLQNHAVATCCERL